MFWLRLAGNCLPLAPLVDVVLFYQITKTVAERVRQSRDVALGYPQWQRADTQSMQSETAECAVHSLSGRESAHSPAGKTETEWPARLDPSMLSERKIFRLQPAAMVVAEISVGERTSAAAAAG